MKTLSDNQLRARLERQIFKAGSIIEWCRSVGATHAQYVGVQNFLAGRRPAEKSILALIGYERVVRYRPVPQDFQKERAAKTAITTPTPPPPGARHG